MYKTYLPRRAAIRILQRTQLHAVKLVVARLAKLKNWKTRKWLVGAKNQMCLEMYSSYRKKSYNVRKTLPMQPYPVSRTLLSLTNGLCDQFPSSWQIFFRQPLSAFLGKPAWLCLTLIVVLCGDDISSWYVVPPLVHGRRQISLDYHFEWDYSNRMPFYSITSY